MPSAAQALASRENARYSTGPRTEAGKTASSRNSLAHGLTSKQIVLPHENREEYDNLRASFQRDYKPANDTERELVSRMADAWWRLQRAWRVETEFLKKAAGPEADDAAIAALFLDNARSAQMRLFLRYLAAAERAWNKALADFSQSRKERDKQMQAEAQAKAKDSLARVYVSRLPEAAPVGFVSQTAPVAEEFSERPLCH